VAYSITTDNLADEVRDGLDEQNQNNVTPEDILQELNRGQKSLVNIVSKSHDEMFLDYATVTTEGSAEFDMPADVYGMRIEKIEAVQEGRHYEVKRVSYRQATQYYSSTTGTLPKVYALYGRKYRLFPTPPSGTTLWVWYTKQPAQMVYSQGRVTSVNTGSNYVTVDAIGEDLAVESDNLASYVNICDAQTGEIKATMQLQSSASQRLTFKSTPARSTVLGRAVVGEIPDTVSADDHVCLIQGTAVPEIPDACQGYVVQYAIVSLKRRLGEPAQDDKDTLKDLEKEVTQMWVGRETSIRVKKVSKRWGRLKGSSGQDLI
jgi:hypothetical protein